VSLPEQPALFLARHGQTDYNLKLRFQGQLPVPLDDTGRAQAAELAERATAYDFKALWCSPLRRARETADAVERRLGLTAREDARLMETDAGDWTDRTFADVHEEAPAQLEAFLAGDPAFAFPGGESFAAQEARVAAALDEIELGDLPALVVCHGMVIRAAFSARAGQWLPGGQRVANGAIVPLSRSGPAEPGHSDAGATAAT
jgi:probable phosphoglycerate mutase